jgi:hypothetical protein
MTMSGSFTGRAPAGKTAAPTAEVAPGARAQKFLFKGLSPTLPPNALTDAQLAAKP